MNLLGNNLIHLDKAQIKPAAEMLARAFQDDQLYTYFFPNLIERKTKLHVFFEGSLRYGIVYGEVYTTSSNLEGVAFWLPSEKGFTIWRMIRSGFLSLLLRSGKKVISKMMAFSDYASPIHKSHTPFRHWYLMYIGVESMFQGKGYASALIKPMLTRIDQEYLPCFLETQNEKNVHIYQNFGFKVVEVGTIPGTNINHWAMLRDKKNSQ